MFFTQMFQFQLVRLKCNSSKLNFHSEKRFQFQLVRLKCNSNMTETNRQLVSIPTGSIKIKFARGFAVHRNPVSIPTGSIKICYPQPCIEWNPMFQCQLVRLRYWHTVPLRRYSFIVSIPTGSIKILVNENSLLLQKCFNSNWFD